MIKDKMSGPKDSKPEKVDRIANSVMDKFDVEKKELKDEI